MLTCSLHKRATDSSYLYANETIRQLAAHDPLQPLYIYLAWNNVHDPNEAPDAYISKHSAIKDKNRRCVPQPP